MNRSVRLSSAQSFCSNAVSFNSRWIWIGKSSTFLWGYWKKNKSHFRNFELCWKYPKQILFMTIFAGAVTFSSNPLVFTHFTVFSNVLSLTACRMGLKLYLCMLTCSHVWHHEPVWNTKFSVVKKTRFHSVHGLTPEIMNGRNNLSKSELLKVRSSPSPPEAIFSVLHMRELTNIPGVYFSLFFSFLNYVCRHCTPHWGCICKMIYSVQHHPRWTRGDGSW